MMLVADLAAAPRSNLPLSARPFVRFDEPRVASALPLLLPEPADVRLAERLPPALPLLLPEPTDERSAERLPVGRVPASPDSAARALREPPDERLVPGGRDSPDERLTAMTAMTASA
jgi:hypothetical protein